MVERKCSGIDNCIPYLADQLRAQLVFDKKQQPDFTAVTHNGMIATGFE
jgi:hypothetical protein